LTDRVWQPTTVLRNSAEEQHNGTVRSCKPPWQFSLAYFKVMKFLSMIDLHPPPKIRSRAEIAA